MTSSDVSVGGGRGGVAAPLASMDCRQTDRLLADGRYHLEARLRTSRTIGNRPSSRRSPQRTRSKTKSVAGTGGSRDVSLASRG